MMIPLMKPTDVTVDTYTGEASPRCGHCGWNTNPCRWYINRSEAATAWTRHQSEAHRSATDADEPDQLYPTPEENFWDDRTTPGAYGWTDSERDLIHGRSVATQDEPQA